MTEATPLASEQITQDADELEALIDKATGCDLADEGRYFSETCNDLTSCRHGETGEYNDQHDGPLVEFLWNHRHHYLSLLRSAALSASPAPSGQGVSGEVDWAAVGHEYAAKALAGGIPQVRSPQYALSGALTAMAQEIERLRAAPAPSCAPGEVDDGEPAAWAVAAERAAQEAYAQHMGDPDGEHYAAASAAAARTIEQHAIAALSPQRLDAATVERTVRSAINRALRAETDPVLSFSIEHRQRERNAAVADAVAALATEPHQHGGKGA